MTVTAPIPHLRVAVVGGGPGGLATAIAMSRVPQVTVTIYEQASILREVGAGINIGNNSWNVLELLGVADSLTTGHPTWTVLNMNGQSGGELHRRERKPNESKRPTIRTQRTALQSALLRHLPPGILQLSKKLLRMSDRGEEGVDLYFTDGSSSRADLVVGADGIRSVVRDTAWTDYNLSFTGTTIWRTLLAAHDVADLDPRFQTTGWWHAPTTHVYFSPVGEGLWEIACRAYHDPETHRADKVSWGVPVANAAVEAHFGDLLPDIRAALGRVPAGGWREFAAFAGPELATLVAWDGRVALVGDASHALSGAFGAGAGFAMEDGWLLAQALQHFRNHRSRALAAFNDIRVPYYSRMYSYLAKEGAARAARLQALGNPSFDDRVRAKIITDGGEDMGWIYQHDIAAAWSEAIKEAEAEEVGGHGDC